MTVSNKQTIIVINSKVYNYSLLHFNVKRDNNNNLVKWSNLYRIPILSINDSKYMIDNFIYF